MKFVIGHIETSTEILIKFSIGNQTFTLFPFLKDMDKNITKEQIRMYKKQLRTALNNLIIN